MFNGILVLIAMAILNFPTLGMFAVILVGVGVGIILFAMVKPLTDEDFEEQEAQRNSPTVSKP